MLHRMPTQNPRLTITLTPEVAAVLKSMSEASGNSQSSIVGELLQASVPVFERVTSAIAAAREMEQSAKDEIAAGLERAQKRLEKQLPLHLATIDEGLRPLLEHAEEVRRRRARTDARTRSGRTAARGAKGGATPVPVTRGSGSTSGGPAGSRKGKARGRV
jgi:hypothetical protein